MEDLLASIRQAIDNDVGGDASSLRGETRGTLMRGALREMRVSLDNHERKGTSPEQEIAELRGRILRNAAEAPPIPPPPRRSLRPRVEPPTPAEQRPRQVQPQQQAPAQQRNDFQRILSTPRPQPQPQQRAIPPALPPPHLPPQQNYRSEPRAELRPALLQDDVLDEIAYGPAHLRQAEPRYEPQQAYYPEEDYYPEPQPAYQPPMLSHQSESAAAHAFRQLSEELLGRASGGRPLEDVTQDLLRGMLKQWLDENLPRLVEQLVREEIQRVARRGH